MAASAGPPAGYEGQHGFLTIQYVVAMGIAMLFLTLLANLIVFQYGRAVVRTALDDGARAGARVTSSTAAATAACLQTAEAVRADLLGGALGDEVTVGCTATGTAMTARGEVVFTPWLPYLPPWRFTVAATARQETAP